jgi:hypothetical protein
MDTTLVWQSNFNTEDWLDSWNTSQAPKKGIAFGADNISVENDGTRPEGSYLRIKYPKGSWSPEATRKAGLPVGGTQFYGAVLSSPATDVTLTYSIRFPNEFNWVKGGKLPGLYGGTGNTGSDKPDGTDGFTTRYMWRENGKGILYPFLPTSDDFGTTIKLGDPLFAADNHWHTMKQRVVLNTVGNNDGQITVWYDDEQISQTADLTFRTVDNLQLNGVLFQTFFGGSQKNWATPVTTYGDFANFQVLISN